MIVAIIVSLLAGVTVVISRTQNAIFAKSSSMFTSTFYNYFFGSIGAAMVLLLIGRNQLTNILKLVPSPFIMYLGGIVGVAVVFILNYTVSRISAFYMTLLLFVSQIFTGIVIDTFMDGTFSKKQLIGGLLVLAGMLFNLRVDQKGMQGVNNGRE